MEDRWYKLWDMATSEPDGDAVIVPREDVPDEVTLRWPDGSESHLYWKYNEAEWRDESEGVDP
jgi:hypothetical protein